MTTQAIRGVIHPLAAARENAGFAYRFLIRPVGGRLGRRPVLVFRLLLRS